MGECVRLCRKTPIYQGDRIGDEHSAHVMLDVRKERVWVWRCVVVVAVEGNHADFFIHIAPITTHHHYHSKHCYYCHHHRQHHYHHVCCWGGSMGGEMNQN